MHSVLCVETIKTMKKLDGEHVCAHTCADYLIKCTRTGNILEGRSHFSSPIWFDFIISFENQKQKQNALINK